MSDHTIADALADAEIVRVEELNSSGEWVDITHRMKERPMTTDHIDRAAEVIAPVLLRDYGMEYDTSHMTAGDFMDPARDIAQALADAGLLEVLSPELNIMIMTKVREAVAYELQHAALLATDPNDSKRIWDYRAQRLTEFDPAVIKEMESND